MDLPFHATYPVRFQVIVIYYLGCNKQAIYEEYVSFAYQPHLWDFVRDNNF